MVTWRPPRQESADQTLALDTARSLGRDRDKEGLLPQQGRNAVEEAVEDEGEDPMVSVVF